MSEEEKFQFVYHIVPNPLIGTCLYPMNALREIHPSAYEVAAQKYQWRKSFFDLTIPKLGCLWNDVLHFTIVHPNHIYNELSAAGYQIEKPLSFFEVPVKHLIGLPHAVYYTPPPHLEPKSYSPDNQAPDLIIDPNMVKLPGEFDFKYPSFPAATRAYFKFEHANGRNPLLFNGLPHFLLQAPLETGEFHRIDWRDRPA